MFTEAGFEWRKSGCSNCAGREGPIWADMRVVSSTNRNFENRQGPRTRTHLASPATVAASAVAGRLADPRAGGSLTDAGADHPPSTPWPCRWLRDNVDTDELIPVSENTRVSQTGWGDGLFAGRRYLPGAGGEAGRIRPIPAFILNRPPFDRAAIVVGGANFGCGCSRESAVWALRDYGFRAVVAVSFNETFERNCIINGVAPLAVPAADAARLAAAVIARDAGGRG